MDRRWAVTDPFFPLFPFFFGEKQIVDAFGNISLVLLSRDASIRSRSLRSTKGCRSGCNRQQSLFVLHTRTIPTSCATLSETRHAHQEDFPGGF